LPTFAELLTSGTENELIISGRVVDGDCKPVAGARVEVWYSDPKDAVRASTDADGRFMVNTTVPVAGGSRAFKISVSLPDGRTLTAQRHFEREPGVSDEALVQVHRDDAGVWRTTLGLTLV
jgi:protocatechuate 3,4-dioxygenase beta subunit